jgi:rifampicin phosphotransferase
MSLSQQERKGREEYSSTDFVLPLSALCRDMLALVGGKAANLGELTSAQLPVPPGFCVTTSAYMLVASQAGLQSVLDEHAAPSAEKDGDAERLTGMAEAARSCILAATLPTEIADAITEAYGVLGAGESVPVAVRSSATAEDLPFASFAGQQDTYLNVVGVEAVLGAVQRCWASLWTERAVSYRESLGLDQSSVKLAVVVQRMIESSVAGVLFTANPLTGKRHQAVIDANPGLGEAVVSGATNPDHFVVNTATGEIVERRLGDKRVLISGTAGGGTLRTEASDGSNQACLSDEQIHALVQLGARVEAHYGEPQDTEWAIDPSGQLWLTQSRPITTLYPLPSNAPISEDVLRVYLSVNVVQGVYLPFTPMGGSAFHVVGSGVTAGFGVLQPDPLSGPPALVDAGERLFLDVTTLLRNTTGRKFIIGLAGYAEARSAPLLKQLTSDPRLSIIPTNRWRLIRTLGTALEKTRAPLYIMQALFRPNAAVKGVQKLAEQIRALDFTTPDTSSEERLKAMETFVVENVFKRIFGRIIPVIPIALGGSTLASRLLGDLVKPEEMQIVLRSLPHNPTTEMDLRLWHLAQSVAANPEIVQHVHEKMPEQLAQEYRLGTLSPALQQGLAEFLALYGHRGVAEIDLGLPRWSEDPTHILGVLTNYLDLTDLSLAPDVQFRRGAQEAESMVVELVKRASRKGWLHGRLVHFFLKRMRELAGLREMPKFCAILLLTRIRELLWTVGKELEQAGRVETAEDIFFMTLPEAHAALSGEDMHDTVRDHRTRYDFEMRRRHIPRVLLSDGTEPGVVFPDDAADESQGVLRGTPASPGRVTAKARVILDPRGAHLAPGEILVAPSTDPGWTPLFLTAGGLVMEMGGAISHGAVVAREYGIPAVVGVAGATEHITTGQQITVDGAGGKITIEEPAQEPTAI